MKRIVGKIPKDTSLEKIDRFVKKLSEVFDPEETIEIRMDEDYENVLVYMEEDTNNKKPYLKVVK